MVVVDSLFAEHDEAGLLALHDCVQGARDRQRLEVGRRVDADRAIGAHRQPGAQLLLRCGRADRHEHDAREGARLSEAQGCLERDLVERVDARLEPFRRHAGAVGLHAHADVVVDDALDADHD